MGKEVAVRAWARRARCAAGMALAMAAGLSFVAPGAAAQQEQVYRGQTVNERGRPTYDAKGIPVGGFVLYPVLDLSETYNDNIFATPANEIDDFETAINPQVNLQSRWSRHQLSLGSYAIIHRYADRNEQNTNDYGVNGQLRLDLAREATFAAGGRFERRTVSRTDPEEARRATPEQVDVTTASASFTQPFVNLRLTASGDVVNYDEVDVVDRDKNRIEYTGRVRLGYDVSPSLTTFVQPFYTMRDYDQVVDAFGFNKDSQVYGGVFGLGYDITGILYGETSVGYYKTEFDDARFTSDSGVFVDSKTTWNVTALTSIIARISRENIATNEIFAGFASSSRRQVRFGIELQHELTNRVIINADASYKRDQFLQTTRTDKTFEAGVNLRFLINNYVSLFASYDYGDRNSDLASAEYTGNRFLIGVRGQL